MIIECNGIKIKTEEDVYEPSEDSFLLADALSKTGYRNNRSCLEMGCGTGLQSILLSRIFRNVQCCDINPSAVDLCMHNSRLNDIKNIKAYKSDLFSNVSGKFDLIVFNTPYLPQSDDETVPGDINHAWDGGKDGRAVIDRFLQSAKDHLEDQGSIIMLESSLSSYDKTVRHLEEEGLSVNIISRQRLSFEELVVIKADML